MTPLAPSTLRQAQATARRLPRTDAADRRPSPPRSATADGFRRSSDRALRGLVAEMARAGRAR